MKIFRLLLISFLLVNLISLTSCEKEEIDPRDEYVGTWNYSRSGSLTFYHNGQSIGTSPINENGTMSISKSGENDLIIGGQTFTVSGTHLSSDPQSITRTNDGVNIVGTSTDNGTLGSNIITINSSITGTWNNSNGASGNFSGSMTITLTK